MNLVVMQPYFFPYIGYFSLFDVADTFIIYDDVSYKKKGWINRNNFWSYSGPQLFTLPVQNASQHKKICELEFSDFSTTKNNFFSLLKHSYSKAPHYRETLAFLEEVFDYQSKNLADFLSHSLLKTVRYLDISVEVVRNSVAPRGLNLSGEDRIIEIAKECGAR
ncbi:MAG: WbqC family protein, partial [Imperialibacter sp.]